MGGGGKRWCSTNLRKKSCLMWLRRTSRQPRGSLAEQDLRIIAALQKGCDIRGGSGLTGRAGSVESAPPKVAGRLLKSTAAGWLFRFPEGSLGRCGSRNVKVIVGPKTFR